MSKRLLLVPIVLLLALAAYAACPPNPNAPLLLDITNYGASGSQQTANCTSNATSTLIGCSGGDFVVGQTIRLPNAGILPSISAPGTVTLACAAQNSGSCTGTATVTITVATPAVVSWTGHGVPINGPVVFTTTGALPTGITAGTTYYVTATGYTANAFHIAATPGGADIATSGSQSGTQTGTVGTVTYGYEIAALQGAPNGAMTAVGSPFTITQAPQSPRANTQQTWVGIATTASWTAVTHATLYVVYKSLNGGPYNYYTITLGASFTDYGNLDQKGFSAAAVGVPAVAPTSPVPNDVFAAITKQTSAGAWTLSPLTYPPQYQVVDALPSAVFPSVPSFNGSVTVMHDDTPAFQTIYQNLITMAKPGHATIYIPPGDYNVYPADVYGGARVFNIMGLTDVTIQGTGWSSRLHQVGDRGYTLYSSFIASPCGKSGSQQPGIHAQERCINYTAGTGPLALVDPVLNGSGTAQLANPSDASTFGTLPEYIIIRTSNTTIYPGFDYIELNKVTAIDSVTGKLTLKYPTNKPYTATLPAPYSACSNCNGYNPQIMLGPYGIVAENIQLKDFWFEGDTNFSSSNTLDGFVTQGLYVHAGLFDTNGVERHRDVFDNFVFEDGPWLNGASFVNGAAGSGDIIVRGNHYVGRGAIAFQMCQEESANINYTTNIISDYGTQDGNGGLLGINQCYNLNFQQNTVTLGNTNQPFVFLINYPNIMIVANNIFHADVMSRGPVMGIGQGFNAVSTNSCYYQARGNLWNVDSNLLANGNISGRDAIVVTQLPATCCNGDQATVRDWDGTVGAASGHGSGSIYSQATCGASNTWYIP